VSEPKKTATPAVEKPAKATKPAAVKVVKSPAAKPAKAAAAKPAPVEKKAVSMKVDVFDQKGKVVEQITLAHEVFGADVNSYLIHAVATAQNNNLRQGTKSTLTRSEVRGHAKKPYRQKGTGNARQGSTKGPQFTGGGINFAPKPRDFSTKINKKQKTAAFMSALSGKLADGELVLLKDTTLAEAKTKNVAKIIKALKLANKTLFVTAAADENFVRSVANIENAAVTTAEQLSVLDIVNSKNLVASVEAIRIIEEACK
jgi:large subunit ribosomal protein L4